VHCFIWKTYAYPCTHTYACTFNSTLLHTYILFLYRSGAWQYLEVICMYMYIYMYMHTYICMYIYIHVYIYTCTFTYLLLQTYILFLFIGRTQGSVWKARVDGQKQPVWFWRWIWQQWSAWQRQSVWPRWHVWSEGVFVYL